MWYSSKIKDIQKLENVQRTFTRETAEVFGLKYWQSLTLIKIKSLQRRQERYIIIQMWKIPNKATSNCVNIQFREHPRQEWKSEVPRMGKRRLASRTLYENSFAVVGPQLWNTLPFEVNRTGTESTFK